MYVAIFRPVLPRRPATRYEEERMLFERQHLELVAEARARRAAARIGLVVSLAQRLRWRRVAT